MTKTNYFFKLKQIRSLLFVLVAGSGTAIVLAISMLLYYNPSGSYIAKNVMLSPNVLSKISDLPTKSALSKNNAAYFRFESYKFSYFNNSLKDWQSTDIDKKKYAKFYDLVGDEESITDPENKIHLLFTTTRFASLILNVNSNLIDPSKDFLKIDFLENGDYFRIFIRDHGKGDTWAYYYYPKIYQTILTLFLSE